jgi:hypothetical protein
MYNSTNTTKTMKRLLGTLAIWLVVTVRHWLRVAVVVLSITTFTAGGYFNGGGWYGAFVGAMVGLLFGVVFAFGAELANVVEK